MGADYQLAQWVPADPSNFSRAARQWSDLQHIVIHCTSGRADPLPVARMWQEPAHGSSAHFVIGSDGSILQAVRIIDVAYHSHAANRTSVGIEHCGRAPGELGPDDPGLPITEAQYQASAALVAWLCWRAALRPDRDAIQGHCEIDSATTHTNCPTQYTVGDAATWDWSHYMNLVDAAYARLSAPSAA